MKKVYLIFTIVLAFAISSAGQILYIENTISGFSDANAFAVDDLQNIYIASQNSNELLKLNSTGKRIKTIGGFGWSEGLFDNPVSLSVTALEVYVADYNNHRIQKFDKDLNFISQFSGTTMEGTFSKLMYPISINLSSLGDLYILDDKNKRIIKVNGFNTVERIFGGYESGNIYLESPKKIKISSSQRVFALDRNNFKIFDQFGNALGIIPLTEEEIIDFTIFEENIYLISKSKIFLLKDNNLIEMSIVNEIDTEFSSIEVKQGKIFILTKDEILVLKEGS